MEIETKENILSAILDRHDAKLSEISIHKLALIADHAYFPRNSIVLGMNRSQAYVYLIITGLARSYVTDAEGNDVVRNFMLEGDFLIGESLFLDTSTEAFDALEDLNCLKFKAEALRQVIMSDEQFKTFYIRTLEATLIYKIQREYEFQNLDARERYQAFQQRFGVAEERMAQNQIASYIGITKESLSRLKKNMKDR